MGPPDNNVQGLNLSKCELIKFFENYFTPSLACPDGLVQAVCRKKIQWKYRQLLASDQNHWTLGICLNLAIVSQYGIDVIADVLLICVKTGSIFTVTMNHACIKQLFCKS